MIGALIGRRITPTELPQTVAALHSVVGLAAVLTSIGSVLAHVSDISTLHMVTAYLGVLIGTYLVVCGEDSRIDTEFCRRYNVHGFYRGFPQACRKNVLTSDHLTW